MWEGCIVQKLDRTNLGERQSETVLLCPYKVMKNNLLLYN